MPPPCGSRQSKSWSNAFYRALTLGQSVPTALPRLASMEAPPPSTPHGDWPPGPSSFGVPSGLALGRIGFCSPMAMMVMRSSANLALDEPVAHRFRPPLRSAQVRGIRTRACREWPRSIIRPPWATCSEESTVARSCLCRLAQLPHCPASKQSAWSGSSGCSSGSSRAILASGRMMDCVGRAGDGRVSVPPALRRSHPACHRRRAPMRHRTQSPCSKERLSHCSSSCRLWLPSTFLRAFCRSLFNHLLLWCRRREPDHRVARRRTGPGRMGEEPHPSAFPQQQQRCASSGSFSKASS